MHAFFGDACDLPPLAIGILATDEDLPLTTITLLHPVHQPATVRRGGQEVLGNPLVGEAVSEVEAVRRITKLAEPNLLLEPGRVSAQRVPEPRAVVTPGN